jgi:DNA-binding LacI/PurR family transcriptional regulator
VEPTVRDVARLAGVGVGTVSRVLNDRPKVGAATRQRVLDAIAQLDYTPNASARSLKSGRTGTIAVVTTHFVAPSVVERVRGIEQSLTLAGLDLMIRNIETKERRDAAVRDAVRADRFDGAILISLSPTAQEQRQIEQSGFPVVLIDAHHRSLPRVVCDDRAGGRLAADHLAGLGHRRIAFIGDPARPQVGVPSSSKRLAGAREVFAAAGVSLRTSAIRSVQDGLRQARDLAQAILRGPDRPTAIMAANDTLAFGALQAARHLAIPVPGQLSVIGYDDAGAAELVRLTTIHQPLYETGCEAVAKLQNMIAGQPADPLRTVLPVSLVQRDTTGPAPTPAA